MKFLNHLKGISFMKTIYLKFWMLLFFIPFDFVDEA